MYTSILLQALLLSSAAALPLISTRYAVKEYHPVPRGWTATSKPSRNHMIDLEIGLKHQNQDKLTQHVVEVSDPSHTRYGQYLSAADVRELIAPAGETVDLVRAWLADHGISSAALNRAGDSFMVRLPVEKVEELLDTTYSVFRHDDGTEYVRAPEWSLPGHLHEHIDVVQPTTSFFKLKKAAASHKLDDTIAWHGGVDWWKGTSYNSSGSCDISQVCNVTGTNLKGETVAATTLTCLRCLYGTIDYVPQVPKKNSIGVANYLNQTQLRSDIKQYLQMYRPEAAAVAEEFPITIVANGPDGQVALTPDEIEAQLDLEADLDGELVIGISWPTKFEAWNTGGDPPFIPDLFEPTNGNEPYNAWLNYVLAQDSLPQVISTSYADSEQTVPYSYAARACNGFKQLGARGVSVLFASGDDGVGSNGTCFSNIDPKKAQFDPFFPPTCPWVTTVGATQGYLPEIAVTRFGSGGGFSNYFPQPSYQTSAVEGYLSKIGNLYAGLYNQSGRGYPDVAAAGNHDVIVWGGNVTTIGGASASTPTFAAVIALVNDALIAAGKPPLGFLNPWIYGGAYKALNDITVGSSVGCNTSGFPAEIGWDAVTGFGTPNFGQLVASAFGQGQGWSEA